MKHSTCIIFILLASASTFAESKDWRPPKAPRLGFAISGKVIAAGDPEKPESLPIFRVAAGELILIETVVLDGVGDYCANQAAHKVSNPRAVVACSTVNRLHLLLHDSALLWIRERGREKSEYIWNVPPEFPRLEPASTSSPSILLRAPDRPGSFVLAAEASEYWTFFRQVGAQQEKKAVVERVGGSLKLEVVETVYAPNGAQIPEEIRFRAQRFARRFKDLRLEIEGLMTGLDRYALRAEMHRFSLLSRAGQKSDPAIETEEQLVLAEAKDLLDRMAAQSGRILRNIRACAADAESLEKDLAAAFPGAMPEVLVGPIPCAREIRILDELVEETVAAARSNHFTLQATGDRLKTVLDKQVLDLLKLNVLILVYAGKFVSDALSVKGSVSEKAKEFTKILAVKNPQDLVCAAATLFARASVQALNDRCWPKMLDKMREMREKANSIGNEVKESGFPEEAGKSISEKISSIVKSLSDAIEKGAKFDSESESAVSAIFKGIEELRDEVEGLAQTGEMGAQLPAASDKILKTAADWVEDMVAIVESSPDEIPPEKLKALNRIRYWRELSVNYKKFSKMSLFEFLSSNLNVYQAELKAIATLELYSNWLLSQVRLGGQHSRFFKQARDLLTPLHEGFEAIVTRHEWIRAK